MKIGDLWPEVVQWLIVPLILVLVLVIPAFPQILVGVFLKKVDYRNNKKIERIKADYGTLKTTVDYLSAAQSKVQPRVVEAVEALWKAILVIKEDYSKAVTPTMLLTSQEIDRCFRKPGEERGEDVLPKYRSLEDAIDCEAFRDSVPARPAPSMVHARSRPSEAERAPGRGHGAHAGRPELGAVHRVFEPRVPQEAKAFTPAIRRRLRLIPRPRIAMLRPSPKRN